jgi:uncharacterized membrane protein YphA (DoxX/SURF4 family)
MMTDKTKNLVVNVCRVVFGLTFVFSGVAKTVDPWGTAIKIGEYLSVYGVAGVGEGVRMALAIAFCAAELMLGLVMTFGVKTRLASVFAVVVMVFFTVVTFLSATWLPVDDCGCFGDAVKLSPWASFGKNVVLLGLALVVWLNARRRLSIFPVSVKEWILATAFACVSVGLGVWCYLHLPLIDFLPYKEGVNLYEAKYGEGEQTDISLLQFAVFNSEGDATEEILSHRGRVYMLCAARLDKLAPACAERFGTIADKAAAEGDKIVLLTASRIPDEGFMRFGSSATVEVLNADATMMKTMLRATAGMVVLENGVIVNKRNCRDIY